MAAMLWPPHAAFVGLVWLLLSCRGESSRCPSGCTCLGKMVECSKRELTEIPPDLPYWVTILELQSNAISSIPNDTFDGLTQLEELDLSNNQLQTMDWTVLQAAPALKKLKLAYNQLTTMPYIGRNANLTHMILNHNSITFIDYTVLDNLPNLRTLDLNFNRLTAIRLNTFPLHASLHQLFLNNNKITMLEVGSFDNLTSLEWLKLKRNKVQRLPKDIFLRLGKLKSLDLAQNRIRTIDGLSFEGLKNLTSLKLRRNSITELMDGAFYGLSSIQHLQLDHNNISRVSRGWLYGLSSLHQLSLAHNRISEVEQEAWEWCQRLWQLNLSHNHLVALMDDTFSHLNLLKFLYLDNNRISYIGERAFSGLASLQTLELSGNDISWTVEDMNGAFDGLESLSRLGLDSNRIKSIAKRAFQGLGQLKQLHLVDNDISSIQSNAFSPILELRELRFNSSNLLCDCQLSWLPHWLTEAGFRESVNARCSHPDMLKGKSIFDVRPNDFKCNDFPKPVIITEPESVVALRGSNVSLRCAAASSSTSELTIQWKKDNVLIESPTNVETLASTNDGQLTRYTSIMHMRDVQNTEEGRYQCVISNDFGSTYSQKARITVHVYPSFTKTPEDVTVRAETTARLECAATGHPAPVIAWQKDGGDDFPAARERRMHVMPSDDVFFIVNVKSFDHGVYSCTATNAAGTIVANATVNVLETPAFVRPMESKVAEIGSTSVLECMASGSPKPKLLWFKDDTLLQPSERHFFTADDQLLIIVQTRPSDAGRYVCEMSNTLGTERGIASLKVVPVNEDSSDLGYDDGSTTTGIIIISVVCCVVGTSLIWVIIIYQTRKKTEEYSSTPTDETTLPGEIASPFHADKEAGSTPNHLQTFGKYGVYPGAPSGHDAAPSRMFGLNPAARGRLAALFPDYNEEDIQASVPLTSEELPPHASDNSIGALHRLPGSDSDTLHSSSPSTHSTRSTHSTGLLQTFHPQPVVVTMAPPAQPPAMEYGHYVQREPAVALIHAVPGTEGSGAEYAGPAAEAQHAPRPPDQQDKGGGTLPRAAPPSTTTTSTLPPQSNTKDLERSSINNPEDWCPEDHSGTYEHPSAAHRDSDDCRMALLSGADSDHDNPPQAQGYGAAPDPDNQNTALLASAEPTNHDTGLLPVSTNQDTPDMSATNQNSIDVQEEPPGAPPTPSAPPTLPSHHPYRSNPHVVNISHDSELRDSPSPTVIPNHVPPMAPPIVVLPHRTVTPAGV